jgi:hypothetical protein
MLTISQFQKLYEIEKGTTNLVERMGWSIVELYNYTYEDVNSFSPKKFNKYTQKIIKKLKPKKYFWQSIPIQTDASSITFGQYIECNHWLQNDPITQLHRVAASLLV